MGERWHFAYDYWKDIAWWASKNCGKHFLICQDLADALVIVYKCVGIFLYKYTKLIKSRKFFKKAVTNTMWTTLTKRKLPLRAKIGGKQRIKMTREEIISMLSKELNSEWTNGVTCLMVENSDSYIPVIVHHNKNELIVEVGEQDKKIYRIGRNELNKTS